MLSPFKAPIEFPNSSLPVIHRSSRIASLIRLNEASTVISFSEKDGTRDTIKVINNNSRKIAIKMLKFFNKETPAT